MTPEVFELNPYSPPEAQARPEPERAPVPEFFPVFVAWEQLRVLYNILLAFRTLIAAPVIVTTVRPDVLVPNLILCAVAANLCFCGGVVLNGYAWWLGHRSPVVTGLLFALGMGVALLLVPPVVMAIHHPLL